MILQIIKVIILIVWIFLTPTCLLFILSKKKDLENLVMKSVAVFIFLPIVSYYLVLVTGNLFTFGIISVISTLFNITLFVLVIKKKIRFRKISIKNPGRVMLVLLLLVMVFNFLTFSFPSKERYNCPDIWAYLNLKSDYIFGAANPPFQSALDKVHNMRIPETATNMSFFSNSDLNISGIGVEELDYYKFQKGSGSILGNYDLKILNDEPYTMGIILSFFIAAFNFIGIRIMFVLIMVITSAMLFLITRRFTGKVWISVIAVILLNTSSIALESFSVNPNYLGMLIMCAIILLLTKKKEISGQELLLAGALFGFLGGLRPFALLFIPGLLVYFYFLGYRKIIPFAAGSALLVAPVLIMNYFQYHNPFQYPGFVFYPLFEHKFLGLTFYTRTLFNFPFYEHLVRTPAYPFPMFIYLPLMFLMDLGLIFFTTMFFGIRPIRDRKLRYFLTVTPLVFFAFLLFNENWRDPKTTILLLILPFAILLSMNGLNDVVGKFSLRKTGFFVLALLLVSACILAARGMSFPPDLRMGVIDRGNLIEFPEHLDFLRQELTRLNVLPKFSSNSINTEELPQDLMIQKAFPFFLEKFIGCRGDNDTVSGYFFYLDTGKTYLIIPHEMSDSYQMEDINTINITSGEQVFRDVSSPDHCYTFDLRVAEEQGAVNLYFYNISRRDYGLTINKKVQLIFSNAYVLNVYEDGRLAERQYVQQ